MHFILDEDCFGEKKNVAILQKIKPNIKYFFMNLLNKADFAVEIKINI